MAAEKTIGDFVEKHLRLIEMERQAEIEETQTLLSTYNPQELEKKGMCLLRLKITDMSSGLGGRTLVTLQHVARDVLPAHKFGPGDIVSLRPSKSDGKGAGGQFPTAVVYRVTEQKLILAMDDVDDDIEEPVRLDKVANDVTYRRMRDSLGALRGAATSVCGDLKEVLFAAADPQFDPPRPLKPFNEGLDASQREAIQFALSARHVAVIHGPPGTGKTTAVVEFIRQAVKRGDKVLAVAPSNIAVDNMVERLGAAKIKLVRLGHPARLLPTVLHFALDAVVADTDEAKLVKDVRKEIDQAQRDIMKTRDRLEKKRLRGEVKRLGKEAKVREDAAVSKVLEESRVVLATLTGAASRDLDGITFDTVVIDEAAQALEPACWIAIQRGRRLILAGDRKQLPPTVKSEAAAKAGLDKTLLDRLNGMYPGDRITRMLTVQYRMHEDIMRWSSDELYGGKLTAHESVAGHLLQDLEGAQSNAETEHALVLIDTTGCDMLESRQAEGESTENEGEAAVVRQHVESLLAAGIKPSDIAVITPYNAQVEKLRTLLQKFKGLEIGSVDGFQGREKEAVVISMVRSNDAGEVGFLADDRRTNVAVTRARRHCCVICDSETVGRHAFLKRLCEYFENHGDIRSAAMYQ